MTTNTTSALETGEDMLSRVLLHDAEIKSVRADQQKFEASVNSRFDRIETLIGGVNATVTSLLTQVGQVGKTDFKTILWILGALVGLGGLGWGAMIAPHVAKNDTQDVELRELKAAVAKADAERMRIQVQFTEIETQFRTNDSLRNEQLQHQERVNSMLWFRMYGEQYPIRDYWPSVGRHLEVVQ